MICVLFVRFFDQLHPAPPCLHTDIFEAVKLKIVTSLVYAALFLLILGMCADAGGQGQGFMYLGRFVEAHGISTISYKLHGQYIDLDADQISILKRAYGFACFCHLVGACLALWAGMCECIYMDALSAVHLGLWPADCVCEGVEHGESRLDVCKVQLGDSNPCLLYVYIFNSPCVWQPVGYRLFFAGPQARLSW